MDDACRGLPRSEMNTYTPADAYSVARDTVFKGVGNTEKGRSPAWGPVIAGRICVHDPHLQRGHVCPLSGHNAGHQRDVSCAPGGV